MARASTYFAHEWAIDGELGDMTVARRAVARTATTLAFYRYNPIKRSDEKVGSAGEIEARAVKRRPRLFACSVVTENDVAHRHAFGCTRAERNSTRPTRRIIATPAMTVTLSISEARLLPEPA